MKAVILSAGQGRRLMPLTENRPKCALEIHGRAMLRWQLGELAQCAIDEIVVVTGFHADVVQSIVDHAPEVEPGVRVRTFHNPFYAKSDNLGTCWIAREEMREPFVIINGDTLFEAAIMQRLLASEATAPITLVTDVKHAYDDDDMKVIERDGRLQRVGKKLAGASVNAESIGMMVFRGDGPDLFRAKIEAIMAQEDGLKRWYLSAIDELAQEGHVAVCCIEGLSWCEVDDRADLELAAHVLAEWYPESEEAAL